MTRPRPGRRVLIRAVAGGGGSSGDSNKTLRTVLLVVIAVVAIAIAVFLPVLLPGVPFIVGIAMAASAVVSLGGGLLINALLPPPKPKLRDSTGFGARGQTYALTGTRNQLAPYQAVPRVYGRHRLYPPLAAFPNTVSSGTEQSLIQLFSLGYGPLAIEDIRIGDTPIEEFSGVELEVRHGLPDDPPLTTFPFAQWEEPLSITLTPTDPPYASTEHADYGPPAVRTTREDVDAVSLEVTLPRGLFRIDSKNRKHNFNTSITVEIRRFDSGDPWTLIRDWLFDEARVDPLRFTYAFNVPTRGQYDVRLQARIPANWGPWVGEQPNPVVVFDSGWTALRSWQYTDPAPLANMAKIGLKIQASGQLSGVVDQLNVVATSVLAVGTITHPVPPPVLPIYGSAQGPIKIWLLANGSGGSSDDATVYVTASLAPRPRAFLVALVLEHDPTAGAAGAPTPTLSGLGLSWGVPSGVAFPGGGSSPYRLTFYVARVGVVASEGPLTVTCATTRTGCAWLVFECTGVSMTSPIGQSVSAGGSSGVWPADGGLWIVGWGNVRPAPPHIDMDAEAGWTRLDAHTLDPLQSPPILSIMAQTRDWAGGFLRCDSPAPGVSGFAGVDVNPQGVPQPRTLLSWGLATSPTVGQTVFTTSPIAAPTANALILAWVVHTSLNAQPAGPIPTLVTGAGLTFDVVATVTWNGWLGQGARRGTLFRAMSPAPVSHSMVATFTTPQYDCNFHVIEYVGAETTGINGANAIVQVATGAVPQIASGLPMNALTLTLPAAADWASAVMACFGYNSQSGSGAASGWSVLYQGYPSGVNSLNSQWNPSRLSTLTQTFGQEGAPMGGLIVEIRADGTWIGGGGVGPTPPPVIEWVYEPTRNPAWIYLDILRGTATARPVADRNIDLETIIAWGEECDARGWTFDAVFDSQTTVYEALSLVAAAGRASFSMRDGKFSVVREQLHETPVQLFTPRNSSGFEANKVFLDLPHALKMRFVDSNNNWRIDERFVYDDGYHAGNATKFEGFEMFGITNADLAWRHGRYWLAAARLRPETYTLGVDIEYLVANRGDLVHVQHDVPMIGYGSARVVKITGAPVTSFHVDEAYDPAAWVVPTAARYRDQTGAQHALTGTMVAHPESRSSEFVLTAPSTVDMHEGDLVSFGEPQLETIPCLITRIEPGPDLTARLTLVDAAPAILDADTGTIPPWQPNITLPPLANRLPPFAPIIDSVASDETAMRQTAPGVWALSIRVTTHVPLGGAERLTADVIEAQFRPVNSQAGWLSVPTQPAGNGDLVTFYLEPVEQGREYDIRLRALNTGQSMASPWTDTRHMVAGDVGLPPAPVNLTLEPDQTRLRWQYPTPPVDFPGGFHVRYAYGTSDVWNTATPAHDGLVTDTSFGVPPLNGMVTWFVKAVDRSGNESEDAAMLTADMVGAGTGNVVKEVDYAALGYPGELDGLTYLEEPPPPRLCNALAEGSTTDFAPGTYTFVVEVPPEDDGTTLTLDWSATGLWTIEYRVGTTRFWAKHGPLFWGGATELFWETAGAWTPWPGALTVVPGDYEFRFTTPGPAEACLTSLTATYDVEDLVEFIDDFAVPDVPTRLPVVNEYRAIVNVQLTVVQSVGDPVRIVDVLDKDPTGPLIRARLADGTATTAQVDALVTGY